ncbi:hypothetical protein H7I77_10280 [Mycolicibacterium novocastrense]|uniref:Uncharacterized protein n=1 Tax=Mycolicibacterium novocastrense TaxID=59813 RepID=A0AAW5SIU2_MYCNV|nr:hypothetical protein [Mycolicibacterium novocastrense]MCV7023733.1 hypothetical protein [Mycolicibacterium novocastrense]
MTTISGIVAARRTGLKSDREVIEDALTLLEMDNGWTQGSYCRDRDGREVRPDADAPGGWVAVRTEHVGGGGFVVHTQSGVRPCSFCLGGALRVAAGYWHGAQPFAVSEQVERLECLILQLANSVTAPGWLTLQSFNDDSHTTKADAVLMLKLAAAHLDAQEQKHR